MARLSPEKPLAYLPIDAATAPGQKSGIDPSLIGVFDETLRQARRSEGGSAADLAPPNRETRPPEATEAPNATAEREDRETDDVLSDDTDAAAVSDGETRSNDEVESDEPARSPEATSGENTERTEAEEDADSPDEPTDEAATDVPVTGQVAVQEAVVEAIEPTVSEGKQNEQVSPSEGIAEITENPTGVQTTASQASGAAVGQSTEKPTVDEAAIATETTDETVDATQEDSGKETESEADGNTPGREKTQGAKSLEKPAAENGNLSAETGTAGDSTEISGEEVVDRRAEHGDKRRQQPTRGEQHEAAARSSDAQATPADAGRGVQTAANPTAAQLQSASAAGDSGVAAPELAVAPDLGAANNAAQTTGSADALTPLESRASAPQSQVAAGQGTGKELGAAVDPAKFVQRVANAFAALGQRSGPVRLKLYPPELGSLRMEITVKNGTMSARVEAETAAAKSVLLDNLPVLRERLAEQGIKVDRFDVDVSDQPQGGPSERPDDGGRSFQQGKRETGSQASAHGTKTNSIEQRDEQSLGIDGRLDVFI